jgi:hypothetical protein
MDISTDDELSILDIFDPFKQPKQQSTIPPESDEVIVQTPPVTASSSPSPPPVSSPSYPHPIKIRLKLTPCSEMKTLSQVVQQIRTEHQLKPVKRSPFNFIYISFLNILVINK